MAGVTTIRDSTEKAPPSTAGRNLHGRCGCPEGIRRVAALAIIATRSRGAGNRSGGDFAQDSCARRDLADVIALVDGADPIPAHTERNLLLRCGCSQREALRRSAENQRPRLRESGDLRTTTFRGHCLFENGDASDELFDGGLGVIESLLDGAILVQEELVIGPSEGREQGREQDAHGHHQHQSKLHLGPPKRKRENRHLPTEGEFTPIPNQLARLKRQAGGRLNDGPDCEESVRGNIVEVAFGDYTIPGSDCTIIGTTETGVP